MAYFEPGRVQGDRRFSSEQEESERLLKIKGDVGIGVAQISNRYVLAEMQSEVAAAGGENEGAGDGRRPDNLLGNEALDVLDYRIAVIAGLAQRGIGVGSENH